MPRYVILDHDHPFPHWDFMLEAGNRLRTWRLLAEPVLGQIIRAQSIGDHRTEYLDYEGPVSGRRGRVVRWDSGTYEILVKLPNEVRIALMGRRLAGTVVMSLCDADDWTWQVNSAYGPAGGAG